MTAFISPTSIFTLIYFINIFGTFGNELRYKEYLYSAIDQPNIMNITKTLLVLRDRSSAKRAKEVSWKITETSNLSDIVSNFLRLDYFSASASSVLLVY